MRSQLGNRLSSPETETDTFAGDSPPLSPRRDEKTWVVFWGKAPGIYDNLYVLPSIWYWMSALTQSLQP